MAYPVCLIVRYVCALRIVVLMIILCTFKSVMFVKIPKYNGYWWCCGLKNSAQNLIGCKKESLILCSIGTIQIYVPDHLNYVIIKDYGRKFTNVSIFVPNGSKNIVLY